VTYDDMMTPIRIFLWLTLASFLIGAVTAFLHEDLRWISRVFYNLAGLLGIIASLMAAYSSGV
jgi:succinate-acetate transporter protein